tara:strand:+ start:280 stop:510 length:231 start_codon:yes stop_codon:yes gene_type:complete
MRLSHKRKVIQKQKNMICGVVNWSKHHSKPGPWYEGYNESFVEGKAIPESSLYEDCRVTRRVYRQGFFFGKKSIIS